MTILIIALVIFVIFILAFPKFLHEYELKSNKIVINNCRDFVSEVKNFEDNKLEEGSIQLVEKYNVHYKNPISKKYDAYTVNSICEGCVSIEYNKETNSLNITGYDKDLKILCRTVVKSSSYVTYERED